MEFGPPRRRSRTPRKRRTAPFREDSYRELIEEEEEMENYDEEGGFSPEGGRIGVVEEGFNPEEQVVIEEEVDENWKPKLEAGGGVRMAEASASPALCETMAQKLSGLLAIGSVFWPLLTDRYDPISADSVDDGGNVWFDDYECD